MRRFHIEASRNYWSIIFLRVYQTYQETTSSGFEDRAVFQHGIGEGSYCYGNMNAKTFLAAGLVRSRIVQHHDRGTNRMS